MPAYEYIHYNGCLKFTLRFNYFTRDYYLIVNLIYIFSDFHVFYVNLTLTNTNL